MATNANAKQIVLITGANRGIGFTLARTLARDHSFHVFLGARNPDFGAKAASTLTSEGLSVEPVTLDLSSDESISRAANAVKEKHGHIDVLVNNAGVILDHSPGPRRPLFHQTFDSNVFGAYEVTEAFIPLLEASPNVPRIVFVSSILGSISDRLDSNSVYSAVDSILYRSSKTALNMVAMHYARKLRDSDKKWKINVVCPGYVATDINGGKGKLTTEEAMPNLVRLCTLGVDGPTETYTDPYGELEW
jgi:NAD(P)-dependent dehydrogenase (short-subunit alcohol dehydrogenase family)